MKKVSLVVALTALCGLAASTYADVQNIRLSGDLRVRGYFVNAAGDGTTAGVQDSHTSQFVAQRTRVSLEADLEDHVLVVVTLRADGIWGQPANLAPAANQKWTIGVSEAYVQLRELFYSPATLKVGRQFLNYGSGLIISSANDDYVFDAGRLVLDYHPLTIDLVAGQVCNPQAAVPTAVNGQTDLLFLNAKYEVSGSPIKDVEAYFGWMPSDNVGAVLNNASPMILGLRTDMAPVENLTASLEGAYEFGDGGNALNQGNISAWVLKADAKYAFKGVAWNPVINAAYTFAQGGGANGRNNFLPWFDDADGYNGYAFAPNLSNIQIFNLGATVKPCANTSLAIEGYYYLKVDKDSAVSTNPNFDFGGPSFVNNGIINATGTRTGAREVGWEIDTVLGYDYSKDVRCQLVYGAFIPDHALTGMAADVVNEVRGEINVKF